MTRKDVDHPHRGLPGIWPLPTHTNNEHSSLAAPSVQMFRGVPVGGESLEAGRGGNTGTSPVDHERTETRGVGDVFLPSLRVEIVSNASSTLESVNALRVKQKKL